MKIISGCSYPVWIDGRRRWLYVVRILQRADEYQIVYREHRGPGPGPLDWICILTGLGIRRCSPDHFRYLLGRPAPVPFQVLDSLELPEERGAE